MNLVTCTTLINCIRHVNAIAGREHLAHITDLSLGGLDLLVMALQT